MTQKNASWSNFPQTASSADGCTWSNGSVGSARGRRGSGSLRGNLHQTSRTSLLQQPVTTSSGPVPSDMMHLTLLINCRQTTLTMHDLCNHHQTPLGETLWAARCIFFFLLFFFCAWPKKRILKSFTRTSQCSVMGASQRGCTQLFLLSLDNTFEMLHCLKISQTASLIRMKIYTYLFPASNVFHISTPQLT